MATNGKRRPPRPRIELVTPAPSAEEAAAVIAAIERFIADTAPGPAPGGAAANPWQRAALVEGISARDLGPAPWADPVRWGGRRAASTLAPAGRSG